MDNEPAVKPMNVWVGAIVLAAIVIGAGAIWGIDWWGMRGSGLPESCSYDLKPAATEPSLVKYRQSIEIPLALRQARAIAVGPDDRVYVAGDKTILVFDSFGKPLAQLALDDEPRCLAVAGAHHAFPGRIYVGLLTRVQVCEPTGKRLAAWDPLGEKAVLTSIATAEHDVFVADAGNRLVLRYDTAGKLIGRIGRRDESRNIRGLVIPSPYFDVAVAPDGLLRVVNPGYHRIESYTFDGDLEFYWGTASLAVEGFCGCCNPVNLAILPEGRCVTAEKGMPRVKVYSPEGVFLAVVAGPETFARAESTILEETRAGHKLPVLDVAADSRGRVLVLDPAASRVRGFEQVDEKPLSQESSTP